MFALIFYCLCGPNATECGPLLCCVSLPNAFIPFGQSICRIIFERIALHSHGRHSLRNSYNSLQPAQYLYFICKCHCAKQMKTRSLFPLLRNVWAMRSGMNFRCGDESTERRLKIVYSL